MEFKYKLKENEESGDTQSSEETPSAGGGGSREKINYNIVLEPKNSSLSDVVSAFDNKQNYGMYLSNLRNTKLGLQKAIEDHFGPSVPSKKKAAEKLRGKPFPPKSKQAIDDFIKNFDINGKTNLLKYKIEAGTLIFPFNQNPTKDLTKKIIKTVMDNAGIEYSLGEIEALDENVKDKLREIIKSKLKNKIQENESLFNLDTKLASKIYDILKEKYPQIGKDFTSSSFFFFLNDNIKEKLTENRYDEWQLFISKYYSSVKNEKSIQDDPLNFIEWMRKNFNPPIK